MPTRYRSPYRCGLLVLFWIALGIGAASASVRMEAARYSCMSVVVPQSCNEGGQCLGYIDNQDYVAYEGVNLTGIIGFKARASCASKGGNIQIRLDDANGPLIGSCSVANTGGWSIWQDFSCALTGSYSGTHKLYLVFSGGAGYYLMNLHWFELEGANDKLASN